jgi:hypothetical protein
LIPAVGPTQTPVLSIILVPLTNKLPVTDVPLEITVSAIVVELAFVEDDITI